MSAQEFVAETVGVIGLGYVGLPLAVAMAEAGHSTVGIDTNASRVRRLQRYEVDVEDVTSEQLRRVAGNLRATQSYEALAECSAIVICVPTPLSTGREPDLSYIADAAARLSGTLRDGQLVVLESTTYPGTTREQLLPILEGSGLTVGAQFNLAYSPERVDPGRTGYTIRNTPKVVGGITAGCLERAVSLYETVCDQIVRVSSVEVAEMSKLHENVYRSINIAFVNELAQLCDRMGISVWEVISTASTKPYGFTRFDPGPGMGGHCLPIDPFYLAYKARDHDFYTEFIELAGKLNQSQPLFCVRKAERTLNDLGKPVRGARILILGVAYKADVGDIRESPALKIIRELRSLGGNVVYHDPHVAELQDLGLVSAEVWEEVQQADLTVIVTAHTGVDYKRVVAEAAMVLDLRGVTSQLDGSNIVRIGEKSETTRLLAGDEKGSR